MECPSCDNSSFSVIVPKERIQAEIAARDSFVRSRILGEVSESELKDRTNFIHNSVSSILRCDNCETLVRNDREEFLGDDYEKDTYDTTVMEHLLQRYIQAFRLKESIYRTDLPKHAKVLEIGSHVGGFLHVAKEWGWDAIGIDIGQDIADFANSKGYKTLTTPIEKSELSPSSFDGIYIWNCFEQLPDIDKTLEEVKKLLVKNGKLVIRTPNAAFYTTVQLFLNQRTSVDECLSDNSPLFKALAYNNLLGLPYQFVFTSKSIKKVLEKHGFDVVRECNAELITLPSPRTPDWASEEEKKTLGSLQDLSGFLQKVYPGILLGPWIELTVQKNIM